MVLDMDRRDLDEKLKSAKEQLMSGRYFDTLFEIRDLDGELKILEDVHEKVLNRLSSLGADIDGKRKLGYDVELPKNIYSEAMDNFGNMEYKKAFSLAKDSKNALERCLYLPFPFLDKDISMVSTIFNDGGKVIFRFRMINRMDTPLGHILLTMYTPPGFGDLPEINLGFIGPKEVKSIKANLKPAVYRSGPYHHSDDIARLIFKNKISIKSTLNCTRDHRYYKLSVKNVSDEPILDLILTPNIPDTLETDENKMMIPVLDPGKTVTAKFPLRPVETVLHEDIVSTDEDSHEEVTEEEKSPVRSFGGICTRCANMGLIINDEGNVECTKCGHTYSMRR